MLRVDLDIPLATQRVLRKIQQANKCTLDEAIILLCKPYEEGTNELSKRPSTKHNPRNCNEAS